MGVDMKKINKYLKKPVVYIPILFIIICIATADLVGIIMNWECSKQAVATQKEEIVKLELANGAMRIRLDNIDKEIDKAHEEVIIAGLTIDYAKDEIRKMTSYISFLQKLCEINDVVYPVYIIDSD